MRRIIKNKVYDTATARLCGTRQINEYESETLYWKKTGEFFLCSADATTGEHVKPLTYYVAKEWTKRNLPAETYNAIFGQSESGEEKTTIARLCLRPSTIAKLRREAARRGITIGGLVDELAEGF